MSDSAQQPFGAALTAVPEPLRHQVSARWQELAPSLATLPPEKWLATLPRVFAASDFVARSCVQQPALLQDLIVSGDSDLLGIASFERIPIVTAAQAVQRIGR